MEEAGIKTITHLDSVAVPSFRFKGHSSRYSWSAGYIAAKDDGSSGDN